MKSIEHKSHLMKFMLKLGLTSPIEQYRVLRSYARNSNMSIENNAKGYFVSYRQATLNTSDLLKHINSDRLVVDSNSRYNLAILLFKLKIIHSFVDARPFGYL